MPLLEPFKVVPRNLRDWSRWFATLEVIPDDESTGTDQIADDAITTTKVLNDAITTIKIPDEAVTLAKVQNITANRILGRLSGAGVVSELTAADLVGLLEAEGWTFASTVQFDGNVGFYTTPPVAQQTDPGSATITTVSGSGDDATINTNFANVDTAIDGLRTALNNLGLTA